MVIFVVETLFKGKWVPVYYGGEWRDHAEWLMSTHKEHHPDGLRIAEYQRVS
jgi:hypothetical protein